MSLHRTALFLSLVWMGAAAAVAQEAPTEFDRSSGGQIDVLTKGSAGVSGSLGLTLSGAGEGYGATFGGSVLQDRLWFFAATSALPGMTDRPVNRAVDAKMTAQLGDSNTLAAAFSEYQRNEAVPARSSFLSLRYDGLASSNLFFSGSIRVLRR
ncbi:MAG TPA: hypothetical protein VM779_14320 [Thermoanaerobaculia bacterium]|nr:hypothetical protein [Thermoanaerobaculia bacterium]